MTDAVGWLLAMVAIPAEPSRHRVAVWRELRKIGAVPLSQGAWTVPDTDDFRAALAHIRTRAQEGGGTLSLFDVHPHDEQSRALIIESFRTARQDEWREFVADCGKFTDEIDREISKRKFTFAELEEEEHSLDRLRRWHRELKKRDVLSLPEATEATERLRLCETALEGYAEQVYAATRGSLNDSA